MIFEMFKIQTLYPPQSNTCRYTCKEEMQSHPVLKGFKITKKIQGWPPAEIFINSLSCDFLFVIRCLQLDT